MRAEIIRKYLDERELSVEVFANMCKISNTAVYKYLKGSPIHPLCAYKIEKGTKGKIRYEDLTDIPLKKTRKPLHSP